MGSVGWVWYGSLVGMDGQGQGGEGQAPVDGDRWGGGRHMAQVLGSYGARMYGWIE